MKNSHWMIAIPSFALVFFICVFLFATDRQIEQTPPKVPEFCIEKEEVVRLSQEFEELKWLIPTKGQRSFIEERPSVKAFGVFSSPFDQAVLSLKMLHTLLDGGYEEYLELVHVQPKESRLEWKQFQALQADARAIVAPFPKNSEKNVRRVFETAIILAHLGESEMARNKGIVYEIQSENSIDFIEEALKKHPEMFPSYCVLSPKDQKLLEQLFPLTRFEKLSQWPHAEKIFTRIKESKVLERDPNLFEAAFLLYQCMIAGRRGDDNASGSLTLNRYTFDYMQKLRKVCLRLKEAKEEEVFNDYLTKLAQWLDLDLDSPLHRLLIKVSMMMDLYTTGEIRAMKEAFLDFSPAELSKIITTFEIKKTGVSDHLYEELYMALSSLASDTKIGKSDKERLKEAVHISFKEFLAKEEFQKGIAN